MSSGSYPTKEATAGARPVPKSPRSTVASAAEAFQQQQVYPSSQPSAVYDAQQPLFRTSCLGRTVVLPG